MKCKKGRCSEDEIELAECDMTDPAQRFLFTEEIPGVKDVESASGQLASAIPTPDGNFRCLTTAVEQDKEGVIKKLKPIQASMAVCRTKSESMPDHWSQEGQLFGYKR